MRFQYLGTTVNVKNMYTKEDVEKHAWHEFLFLHAEVRNLTGERQVELRRLYEADRKLVDIEWFNGIADRSAERTRQLNANRTIR